MFRFVCSLLLMSVVAHPLRADVAEPLTLIRWWEFRAKTGGNFLEYFHYREDFYHFHPADANHDHVIDVHELGSYATAWRSGEPWPSHANRRIPIDSLTLAAQIQWDFDGLYFYFRDHFAGVEEEDDIYRNYGLISPGGGGSSWLATEYFISKPANITVMLNEPESWTAMAVEEILPEGWSAEVYQEKWETLQSNTRISAPDISRDDSKLATLTVTEQAGRSVVRWGPFDQDGIHTSSARRDLRYAITHPDSLLPTNDQFEGIQSYDGSSRPTLEREIKPPFELHYPQFNDFGVNISDADVEVPNVDLGGDENGDGMINLIAWIVRGSPEASLGSYEPSFELFEEDGESWVRCLFYQAFESDYIQRIFLSSPDLKAWYRISLSDIVITPMPELDRGAAKAYEAVLSASGDAAEYFKLLYREDLYRTSRVYQYLPTPIEIGDYFMYRNSLEESANLVLSVSAEEFTTTVPAKSQLFMETKRTSVDVLVVNQSDYELSPLGNLRIDNPGSKPLLVHRVGAKIIVEDPDRAGYYFDGSKTLRRGETIVSTPVFFSPDN